MLRYNPFLQLSTVALIAILGILVAAPLWALAHEAILPLFRGMGILATLNQWLGQDAGQDLLDTLSLAALTTLFSLVLGGSMGLLVHLAPPRGFTLLEPLILASFLIPPYLTAVAWSLLAGPVGLLQLSVGFGGLPLSAGLYTLPGIAFVMALHLTPLVYVMVIAALRGVDDRLVDCARVHGANSWRALWTAYRPTVLPALAAAALLVFLASCEEFGVPKVLGNYAGVRVLSVAVEEAMNVWPIDLSRAAGIGLILAVLALTLWTITRFISQGEPVSSQRRIRTPRWWSALPLMLFAFVAAGLPLAAIGVTALQKAITKGLQPGNWTLQHFVNVLTPGGSGLAALSSSVTLAIIVSILGMMLAILTAWVLEGLGRGSSKKLEVFAYLPQAFPGVVLGTGLILVWNSPWNPLPIYGHSAILAIAYLTLTFPYALRYPVSGLSQAQAGLSQAGSVHGASHWRIITRIRLPLAWPMLVAGATVVFALSMRELAASILLQPPGMQVISTYVFEQFDQGNAGDGMALAMVGVVSSAVLLGIARKLFLSGDKNPKAI
jgi:iron(III) transport system permease protein